jgi:hypothetical protein
MLEHGREFVAELFRLYPETLEAQSFEGFVLGSDRLPFPNKKPPREVAAIESESTTLSLTHDAPNSGGICHAALG